MNLNEVYVEIAKREAVIHIIDGKTNPEISRILLDKFGLHKVRAYQIIDEIKEYLKNFSGENFEEIILTHLSRYEYIYKRAIELGLRVVARKALRSKEKLLNLHKEVANIHVTNVYTEGESSPYDFSRLSAQELKRFDELTSRILQIKNNPVISRK